MDSIKIEKLRIAANQFYLNKYMDHPIMEDTEYDPLKDEYETEGGSIFDLVEWEDDMKRTHTPLPKVDKEQVGDNNLENAVENWINKHNIDKKESHRNYKYDGSSIIAYYNEKGQLQKILGTPDCEICIDRTKNCFNMFPHQVTPGIECIQGEFLVDASAYRQKARNKANGLLNSKDMIKDLENEGFIRAYQMRFYDGNWSYKRLCQELDALPILAKDRTRPCDLVDGQVVVDTRFDAYFAPAERIKTATDSIIVEEGLKIDDSVTDDVKFQVDGIVLYYENPDSNQSGGYHAFKFYFTEYAITTVTEIVWNKAGSGSWQPKLNFEGVVLNDKEIHQAASGGYPNLVGSKIGKGAKIKVVLANMTIPKVIEVLEPSEDYQIPTCGCGRKLNPDTDLFGSGLKCTELDCSQRYEDRVNTFDWWFRYRAEQNPDLDRSSIMKSDMFGVIDLAFNIDRWTPKGRLKDKSLASEDIYSEMHDLLTTAHNPIEVKIWMESHFHFPGLCQSILDINYVTADKILTELFNSI